MRQFFGLSMGLALVVVACGGSNSGAGGSSGGSDPAVSTSECTTACKSKATGCGAPAAAAEQRCAAICAGTVTRAQLTCLTSESCEALMAIGDSSSLDKVCPTGSSSSSSSGGPARAFGDACKCDPDSNSGSGEFECTGVCSSGLWCVGTRTQGVDNGTCVGPVCCSGESDCAAKLGQQANCASGQECKCSNGDLECAGNECTCSGGVATSRGLCWKKF